MVCGKSYHCETFTMKVRCSTNSVPFLPSLRVICKKKDWKLAVARNYFKRIHRTCWQKSKLNRTAQVVVIAHKKPDPFVKRDFYRGTMHQWSNIEKQINSVLP